jgi:hypothetical protein
MSPFTERGFGTASRRTDRSGVVTDLALLAEAARPSVGARPLARAPRGRPPQAVLAAACPLRPLRPLRAMSDELSGRSRSTGIADVPENARGWNGAIHWGDPTGGTPAHPLTSDNL